MCFVHPYFVVRNTFDDAEKRKVKNRGSTITIIYIYNVYNSRNIYILYIYINCPCRHPLSFVSYTHYQTYVFPLVQFNIRYIYSSSSFHSAVLDRWWGLRGWGFCLVSFIVFTPSLCRSGCVVDKISSGSFVRSFQQRSCLMVLHTYVCVCVYTFPCPLLHLYSLRTNGSPISHKGPYRFLIILSIMIL